MLLVQFSRILGRHRGCCFVATRLVHGSGGHGFKHKHTEEECIEDGDALVRIGKGIRTIISDMESLCSNRTDKKLLPLEMFSKDVTVSFQNGPNDVLYSFSGRQRLRFAHRSLHVMLPLCYGVCYDHLSCAVTPLSSRKGIDKNSLSPVELKVKWVLRGHHHPPFFLYKIDSSGALEVLLEAYCTVLFDRCSGRVFSIVVDWVAAVPPVDLQMELDLVQPYWLGGTRVPVTQTTASSSSSSQQLPTHYDCSITKT